MLRRLASKGYDQVVVALLEEAPLSPHAIEVFVDAPEHLYYVPERLVAFLDLFQVSGIDVC